MAIAIGSPPISTAAAQRGEEGINETMAIKDEMKEQEKLNTSMGNLNTFNTDFNSLINMSNTTETIESNDTTEEEPKAITQSLELGGENSKEITIDEANAQLQSDDPWLQRKMAEQKENSQ